MTAKSLKHHKALQPLFAIIGAGMVFVGAYLFRQTYIMMLVLYLELLGADTHFSWRRDQIIHRYYLGIFDI